jgi:hypothetical protein
MTPEQKREWEEWMREDAERLNRLCEIAARDGGQIKCNAGPPPKLNKDGSLAGPEEAPEEGEGLPEGEGEEK